MKSEARRAAIVATAVRLFAEKGFRGTTTRELASAVGVTEPVLYQHFQTKSELYTAIIETKAQEGHQRTVELLAYVRAEDDRGFLTCLGDLILERYQNDPNFIRLLLFSALERHELAALFFKRQMQEFHGMVAGYIRKRVKAGAFRPIQANAAARGFIGMVSHHGLVEVLFPQQVRRANRRRLVDEMVTAFLHGVARGAPAAETRS